MQAPGTATPAPASCLPARVRRLSTCRSPVRPRSGRATRRPTGRSCSKTSSDSTRREVQAQALAVSEHVGQPELKLVPDPPDPAIANPRVGEILRIEEALLAAARVCNESSEQDRWRPHVDAVDEVDVAVSLQCLHRELQGGLDLVLGDGLDRRSPRLGLFASLLSNSAFILPLNHAAKPFRSLGNHREYVRSVSRNPVSLAAAWRVMSRRSPAPFTLRIFFRKC